MTLDPLIGRSLGDYSIVDLVGRGGMGIVYRATHPSRGEVALKVMAPEFSRNPEFRERFIRESQLGLDHPHIVPVYEAGEADGHLYMAMYLVRGADLKSVIRREGRLPPSRILTIFRQAADALDAAHAEAIVHRDVKPQNFLIEDAHDGRAEHLYLSDFGLVKRVSSSTSLTGSAHLVGTAYYMSPEQIRGKDLDGRADVYSLGCVLYECLTGSVPFHSEEEVSILWGHVNDAPPLVTDKVPTLPLALDDVVAQAMAKDPDDRYLTAGDLIADLENVLGFSTKKDRGEWASFEISTSKKRSAVSDASAARETATIYNDRRNPAGWVVGVTGILAALMVWMLSGDETPLEKVQQLPVLSDIVGSPAPSPIPDEDRRLRPRRGAESTRDAGRRPRSRRGTGPRARGEAVSPGAVAQGRSDSAPEDASDGGGSAAAHPASGTYVFGATGNQQPCSPGGACLDSWPVPKRHEVNAAQLGLSNEPLMNVTAYVSSRMTIKARYEYAYDEVRLHDLIIDLDLEQEYGGRRTIRITPEPVVDWLVYPLVRGKAWSGEWSSSPTGSYSVEVLGSDTVRVGGRKISASVVETSFAWTGSNEGRFALRLWVDPKTHFAVASSAEVNVRTAQAPQEMRFIAVYRTELISGPGYGA